MTMVLVPSRSPVPSYQRGRGISIVSTSHMACSSGHSRSRSLVNTPLSPRGSDRSTSFWVPPSLVRMSASAVTRL